MSSTNGSTQKLLDLKKKIDEARQDKAKLQGQLEAFNGELKKLGIDGIEEAEVKLKEHSASIMKKQQAFDTLYEEIEDALQ